MLEKELWLDVRFWEVLVGATSALLGFLGGTVVTHALTRRRDRLARKADAMALAAALHAEIRAIRDRSSELARLLGSSAGATLSAKMIARAIGMPTGVVFRSNSDRLGLLPTEVCRDAVAFYAVRASADGLLEEVVEVDREALLARLARLSETSVPLLRSLHAFLGRADEPEARPNVRGADLPVRNSRPERRADHLIPRHSAA